MIVYGKISDKNSTTKTPKYNDTALISSMIVKSCNLDFFLDFLIVCTTDFFLNSFLILQSHWEPIKKFLRAFTVRKRFSFYLHNVLTLSSSCLKTFNPLTPVRFTVPLKYFKGELTHYVLWKTYAKENNKPVLF